MFMNLKYRSKIILYSFIFIGIVIGMVYNVLWDLFLVFFLLFSSYCVTIKMKIYGNILQVMFIKVSLGMGIIGFCSYLLLLFGIGSKAVFFVLLFFPALIYIYDKNRKKNMIFRMMRFIENNDLMYICILLVGCFIIFTALAASPINTYDACAKHVPIILKAANNGGWYTNVVESVVYGESMLMQHAISVIFVTLGAEKALTLFPMVIHFLVCISLCFIGRDIYKKINLFLLICLYLSVPMFFEKATMLSIDMLAIYFWLTSVMMMVSLNKNKIFNNFPFICFLYGCSLFSKFTTSYFILVTGLIVLVITFYYCLKEKKLKELLKKYTVGFLLFIMPVVVGGGYIWYKVGNPLFPLYNEIFKSPYYLNKNFVDPYVIWGNKLGVNFHSLLQLVFHTSNNTEIHDGGLGLYLLFVFLIPIGILLVKNKKMWIWSIIPFCMFQIACFFSYNSRYAMGALVIIIPIVIISITVIADKILKRKSIFILYNLIFMLILILPNLYFIGTNMGIQKKIIINNDLTSCANKEILNKIPPYSRVFSLNDVFQGEFKGEYYNNNWYTTFVKQKIVNQEIEFKSFINSFDYVMYYKEAEPYATSGEKNYVKNLQQLLETADTDDGCLKKFAEDSSYVIYEVIHEAELKVLLETEYDDLAVNVLAPQGELLENKESNYILTQTIYNPLEHDVEMRWQINWLDEESNIIGSNISLYMAKPGIATYSSVEIQANPQAKYAIVMAGTHTEDEVYLQNMKIESNINVDVLNYLETELKERTLLTKFGE